MRDVERLREKIEISLDDRQVWALGLSALLALGGVFTVGVLLGRKTAPPQQNPAGDLAALDVAAGSDQGSIGPQAGAAGGPQAAGPAGPQATAKSEEKVVEKPAAPGSRAAEKGDDAVEVGAAEKPAGEKHDATMGRASARAVETPRPAVTVPAARPATVVPAPPHSVQVASATPVALTPPPRDLGQFTVQIGASQDRAEAQRMENRARAAGLKPYAVEADLGAKGTWYRVRVGAFHDKDAANSYRRDVERELRSPAVVMSSK
jgi:cell division septation protein DedD